LNKVDNPAKKIKNESKSINIEFFH